MADDGLLTTLLTRRHNCTTLPAYSLEALASAETETARCLLSDNVVLKLPWRNGTAKTQLCTIRWMPPANNFRLNWNQDRLWSRNSNYLLGAWNSNQLLGRRLNRSLNIHHAFIHWLRRCIDNKSLGLRTNFGYISLWFVHNNALFLLRSREPINPLLCHLGPGLGRHTTIKLVFFRSRGVHVKSLLSPGPRARPGSRWDVWLRLDVTHACGGFDCFVH